MNVRMWQHAATQRNVARLRADGVTVLDPDEGPMACGEYGPGRLPEPDAILAAIQRQLAGETQETPRVRRLDGRHIIVPAGPTHEPIEPARYITNLSSWPQGFATAGAPPPECEAVTMSAGPVTPT